MKISHFYSVDFVFFGHFEPFWAQKHQKTKKKQHVELASIVASYHPLRLAGVRTFEDSAFFGSFNQKIGNN